jgi:hypothetical protein
VRVSNGEVRLNSATLGLSVPTQVHMDMDMVGHGQGQGHGALAVSGCLCHGYLALIGPIGESGV